MAGTISMVQCLSCRVGTSHPCPMTISQQRGSLPATIVKLAHVGVCEVIQIHRRTPLQAARPFAMHFLYIKPISCQPRIHVQTQTTPASPPQFIAASSV
jgi:hypothetical protein